MFQPMVEERDERRLERLDPRPSPPLRPPVVGDLHPLEAHVQAVLGGEGGVAADLDAGGGEVGSEGAEHCAQHPHLHRKCNTLLCNIWGVESILAVIGTGGPVKRSKSHNIRVVTLRVVTLLILL